MGNDAKIGEAQKAPLLLASMGNPSPPARTVAALRTKDTDQFSWGAVTSGLIPEWAPSKASKTGRRPQGGASYPASNTNRQSGGHHRHQFGWSAKKRKNTPQTCDYCGLQRHTAEKRFGPPDSPDCTLPKHALDK